MVEYDRTPQIYDVRQPTPKVLEPRLHSPLILIMDANLLEAQADLLLKNSETLFRNDVKKEVNLLRLGATAKRITAKLIR